MRESNQHKKAATTHLEHWLPIWFPFYLAYIHILMVFFFLVKKKTAHVLQILFGDYIHIVFFMRMRRSFLYLYITM